MQAPTESRKYDFVHSDDTWNQQQQQRQQQQQQQQRGLRRDDTAFGTTAPIATTQGTTIQTAVQTSMEQQSSPAGLAQDSNDVRFPRRSHYPHYYEVSHMDPPLHAHSHTRREHHYPHTTAHREVSSGSSSSCSSPDLSNSSRNFKGSTQSLDRAGFGSSSSRSRNINNDNNDRVDGRRHRHYHHHHEPHFMRYDFGHNNNDSRHRRLRDTLNSASPSTTTTTSSAGSPSLTSSPMSSLNASTAEALCLSCSGCDNCRPKLVRHQDVGDAFEIELYIPAAFGDGIRVEAESRQVEINAERVVSTGSERRTFNFTERVKFGSDINEHAVSAVMNAPTRCLIVTCPKRVKVVTV